MATQLHTASRTTETAESDVVEAAMVEVVPAPEQRGRLTRLAARIFTRADGRAPVWLEAIVVLWLLWLYDQINNLAPLRRIAAYWSAVVARAPV